MSAGDGPPSGDDGTGSSAGSDAGRSESGAPDGSAAADESARQAESGHSNDSTPPAGSDSPAQPTGTDRRPSPEPGSQAGDATEPNVLRRFWSAQDGPLMLVREVLTSALAVVAVGLLLFAISGVWPPMVAVESGSMEPHMSRGDLVFITEPGRYAPDAAVGDTGVVTHETATETGYRTFGDHGSVIVYDRPDRFGPPVIHRARLHVEAGENWYDRANPEYMDASNCRQLQYCPAPYDGFITKGDANPQYDQVSGIAAPVETDDIAGIARVRVPYLGYVRLGFATATQAESTEERATSSQFSTVVSSRNGGVNDPAGPSAVRASGVHAAVSTGTPGVA
jgi:signal peptidase